MEELIEKLAARLSQDPSILNMSQFSMKTECGTTYCLAGLILTEAGIEMAYDQHGRAISLARWETKPEPFWVDFEFQVTGLKVPEREVWIQARAREIWARRYGEYAGKILPLYLEGWGDGVTTYDQVTAEKVICYIRAIEAGLHLDPQGARTAA